MFAETTNPPVATGDGMAMALRAGAALLDMEFVQFHPTALNLAGAPRFLISEAVRGEGAHLHRRRRASGSPRSCDPATRWRGPSFGRSGRTAGRFGWTSGTSTPSTFAGAFRASSPPACATASTSPREPIPVTPAAHYVMGGVATDLDTRSTLPGLYAAGECAGTGVHGANRLASNSLLEGLVFGARAADAMAEERGPAGRAPEAQPASTSAVPPEELRRRAWEALGLERDAAGLEGLLEELGRARMVSAAVESRAQAEARNLTDVAWAMAASALFREESRGAHYPHATSPRPTTNVFADTRCSKAEAAAHRGRSAGADGRRAGAPGVA